MRLNFGSVHKGFNIIQEESLKKEKLKITPEKLYLSRRNFIRNGVLISAGALLVTGCGPNSNPLNTNIGPATSNPAIFPDKENTYQEITSYTNFYEFSEDKSNPSFYAKSLKTSPWKLTIDGLVNKPASISMEELIKQYPSEERIYRMRCVEGWSMVIPWLGFPLNRILKAAEPTAQAKFVRFVTLLDPSEFINQNNTNYPWPYVEGLRLDEAMHDLTILATGLYGKDLPPQNGGPIRLVVPWKYGFKSIKSIVHIELMADQPQSFWMKLWPEAYGFYANVNPNVSHPRWSQETELRIGETKRRNTLLFNGYADEVANLYQGMDLAINY